MKKTSRTMAVIGILLGMAVLAAGWSSINMSLGTIQSELGASVLQLQWMMNLYGISICIALLPIGKLGDAYGRKWFFMAGLIGFVFTCLGAGSAQSPAYVIGFMSLFGFSGACVLTLSQALIVHQFPENQKSKAIAIWATFTSIALALGPILGGVVIRYLSWRWVFFINVPIAIAALILVYFFVKKEEAHSAHCEWSGVLLLALIVGGLVSAILQGPAWGWGSWEVVSLFAISFAALVLFILLERRSKEPLFQTKLFANRGFLFASICNGCIIGFVWSIFFFLPLFLQNEKGATSLQAGFKMLLITIPVAGFSMLVAKLYERIGAKLLLVVGFLILFSSVFFQKQLPIEVFCLMIGCGWVLTWGPSTSKALSSLPYKMAGIASGMFMTLQEIGGVVGLAIAGVAFRVGTKRHLAPHMNEIQNVLQSRSDALISDPIAAEKIVGSDSPVLAWLHQGFNTGYEDMMLFLSVLMLLAVLSALLLPKHVKIQKIEGRS